MLNIRKLFKNVKGATAIEYGLIAALIAVACIVALTAVGGELNTTFSNVDTKLKAANDASGGGDGEEQEQEAPPVG